MNLKKNMVNKKEFNTFILDVDGVITTGRFFYSNEGKLLKEFGPDDHDALKIISEFLRIEFISADKNGFEISKKRIEKDMGFKLSFVTATDRLGWFKQNTDLLKTIYMGDSFSDIKVFKEVGYSISPSNADENCKKNSDYVTNNSGGNRAVAEASFHILSHLLKLNLEDYL